MNDTDSELCSAGCVSPALRQQARREEWHSLPWVGLSVALFSYWTKCRTMQLSAEVVMDVKFTHVLNNCARHTGSYVTSISKFRYSFGETLKVWSPCFSRLFSYSLPDHSQLCPLWCKPLRRHMLRLLSPQQKMDRVTLHSQLFSTVLKPSSINYTSVGSLLP